LGSATVVGDRAIAVDGLATAFMVLGEQRAPALAVSQGIAAYFTVRDGDALRGVASPAFEAYLARSTPDERAVGTSEQPE
jgi:thiamine biosynthesis lipoprotein